MGRGGGGGFDLETARPRLLASEDPSSRMRARTCTGETQLSIPAETPFPPTARHRCDTDHHQRSWQQQSEAESLALVRHTTTIPSRTTAMAMPIMAVRTTIFDATKETSHNAATALMMPMTTMVQPNC